MIFIPKNEIQIEALSFEKIQQMYLDGTRTSKLSSLTFVLLGGIHENDTRDTKKRKRRPDGWN